MDPSASVSESMLSSYGEKYPNPKFRLTEITRRWWKGKTKIFQNTHAMSFRPL